MIQYQYNCFASMTILQQFFLTAYGVVKHLI